MRTLPLLALATLVALSPAQATEAGFRVEGSLEYRGQDRELGHLFDTTHVPGPVLLDVLAPGTYAFRELGPEHEARVVLRAEGTMLTLLSVAPRSNLRVEAHGEASVVSIAVDGSRSRVVVEIFGEGSFVTVERAKPDAIIDVISRAPDVTVADRVGGEMRTLGRGETWPWDPTAPRPQPAAPTAPVEPSQQPVTGGTPAGEAVAPEPDAFTSLAGLPWLAILEAASAAVAAASGAVIARIQWIEHQRKTPSRTPGVQRAHSMNVALVALVLSVVCFATLNVIP